jgi:hypothetical protein
MAYTTIYVAPGLSAGERRRAHRCGPRAVASRGDQQQLLVSAGFVDIEMVDVTAEFATTARAWIDGWDQNAGDLAATESTAVIDQRQRERRRQLWAIDNGLLRRALFSATRRR